MVWRRSIYGGDAALKQRANRRSIVVAPWVLRVVDDERATADGAVGICAEVFVTAVVRAWGASTVASAGTPPRSRHQWRGQK